MSLPEHIDVETFSSVNLKTRGLYVYSESPDLEIMLLSYAFDDEPVKTFALLAKTAADNPRAPIDVVLRRARSDAAKLMNAFDEQVKE